MLSVSLIYNILFFFILIGYFVNNLKNNWINREHILNIINNSYLSSSDTNRNTGNASPFGLQSAGEKGPNIYGDGCGDRFGASIFILGFNFRQVYYISLILNSPMIIYNRYIYDYYIQLTLLTEEEWLLVLILLSLIPILIYIMLFINIIRKEKVNSYIFSNLLEKISSAAASASLIYSFYLLILYLYNLLNILKIVISIFFLFL